MKSLVIGIDFDGSCTTHNFPAVGQDIGAVPVLKRLVENGHRLVLFTMRSNIENPTSDKEDIHPVGGNFLDDAVNWFKENDIPLFGVNINPDQHTWTKSNKAYCHLYIDDAGIGTPLVYGKHERPYIDWVKVEKILEEMTII